MIAWFVGAFAKFKANIYFYSIAAFTMICVVFYIVFLREKNDRLHQEVEHKEGVIANMSLQIEEANNSVVRVQQQALELEKTKDRVSSKKEILLKENAKNENIDRDCVVDDDSVRTWNKANSSN